jgi:uncharacterized protein YwgA
MSTDAHDVNTRARISDAVYNTLHETGHVTVPLVKSQIALSDIETEEDLEGMYYLLKKKYVNPEDSTDIDQIINDKEVNSKEDIEELSSLIRKVERGSWPSREHSDFRFIYPDCRRLLMDESYKGSVNPDILNEITDAIPSSRTISSHIDDMEKTKWVKLEKEKKPGRTSVWTAGRQVLLKHDLREIPEIGVIRALANHTNNEDISEPLINDDWNKWEKIKTPLRQKRERELDDFFGDKIWGDIRHKLIDYIEMFLEKERHEISRRLSPDKYYYPSDAERSKY